MPVNCTEVENFFAKSAIFSHLVVTLGMIFVTTFDAYMSLLA
mgnify:CR=1 FL=1